MTIVNGAASAMSAALANEGINFAGERTERILRRLREFGFEVTAASKPNVDYAEIQRMIQDEL